MAGSRVQGKGIRGVGVASVALQLTSAVTLNNLLYAAAKITKTVTLSIADDQVNTWTQTQTEASDGSNNGYDWWATAANVSTNPTVTVTLSSGTGNPSFILTEASGITTSSPQIDKGTNGTAVATTSYTVTTAGSAASVGDWIVASFFHGAGTDTKDAAYTAGDLDAAAASTRLFEEWQASASGSVTATDTGPNSNYSAHITVFKQSGGAVGPVIQMMTVGDQSLVGSAV